LRHESRPHNHSVRSSVSRTPPQVVTLRTDPCRNPAQANGAMNTIGPCTPACHRPRIPRKQARQTDQVIRHRRPISWTTRPHPPEVIAKPFAIVASSSKRTGHSMITRSSPGVAHNPPCSEQPLLHSEQSGTPVAARSHSAISPGPEKSRERLNGVSATHGTPRRRIQIKEVGHSTPPTVHPMAIRQQTRPRSAGIARVERRQHGRDVTPRITGLRCAEGDFKSST
jgi:hypothetical protein